MAMKGMIVASVCTWFVIQQFSLSDGLGWYVLSHSDKGTRSHIFIPVAAAAVLAWL